MLERFLRLSWRLFASTVEEAQHRRPFLYGSPEIWEGSPGQHIKSWDVSKMLVFPREIYEGKDYGYEIWFLYGFYDGSQND